ncbi:MAG: 23S rRNA (uracil(1939)-C(5))-methyltransferase RlmD [Oscillospiraceae bacterium]|jgi:23S rRNA (uracil1939-C5)-methyltransferase|nr:23S rRNA (uracil(1939)-C(5))-methyltransferase RlmD [Oscillospiraceae bacterium]
MKKNEIIESEITGMTLQGAGIARCGGVPVFIPATCTGDRLRAVITKAKGNCAFGKIDEILVGSPLRVSVDCPAFPRCGGCAFRHIRYADELELKQRELTETLRRIGGVQPAMQPIVGAQSPDRYRNKALLPLRREGGRVEAGFFARHSHRVIPCGDCLLAPQAFAGLVRVICAWAEASACSVYDEESGAGLLRQIYLRQSRGGAEILVTLVINGNSVPRADHLIRALRHENAAVKGILLNHNTAQGNTILGPRCTLLWGAERITETLCGLDFALSPLSFFQVNPAQAERLYAIAAQYALAGATGGALRLLDLYCGTGAIGLSVLQAAGGQGELIGVECIPQAVEDAKRNAAANGVANTRFLCTDAAKAAAQLAAEGWQPDVILIDPPRKGCEPTLLHCIAKMAPRRLVYISCDPATLARDLATLAKLGYKAREATPVDMFPRAGHVETVALLEQWAFDA